MAITTGPLQKTHLKTLQIVRAVASTSVVYFHIGSVPCFGGAGYLPCFGGFGVDIFFVLSGFVMAMVVTTGQSGKHFAINRISRIVPLYWALTTFLLVLAALKPELLNSTTANLSHYLKSIFFIPYIKENGTLTPMLFVGWSLNYEMFFYFCVWLSIVTARKHFLWLTIGFVLATYISLGRYADNQVLIRFFGNEMIYEFIFGMVAFHAYEKQYLGKVSNIIYFCAALAGYVFMATAEANGINGIGIRRLFLYGVPSSLLVYSAVCLEGVISSAPRLVVNILTSVGDASYATYLSHIYVTQAVRKVLFQKFSLININNPFGVSITLIIALTAGAIVYKLIDQPLSQFCKSQLGKVLLLHLKFSRSSSRGPTDVTPKIHDSPKGELSGSIIAVCQEVPMRQSKFTETPIVPLLKEADAGCSMTVIPRKH